MDSDVDALFALPPAEFTAARNALVKQLRAEKKKDEAEGVKTLRRPSVPAWALNQVARSQPELVEQLFEAGAGVATAQRRALSGVKGAGLREASARRREAVDAFLAAAAGVLREAGTDPQTHRQPMAATLEAASADDEVGDLLRAGRLTTDAPAPSGFGDVLGFALVPDTAETEDEPTDEDADVDDRPKKNERARARLEQQLLAARHEATTAARRARDLRDRAAQQRHDALRTTAEAERLEKRAAQVRAAAKREVAAADELDDEAAQAERAAADAQAEVERLEASVAGDD